MRGGETGTLCGPGDAAAAGAGPDREELTTFVGDEGVGEEEGDASGVQARSVAEEGREGSTPDQTSLTSDTVTNGSGEKEESEAGRRC